MTRSAVAILVVLALPYHVLGQSLFGCGSIAKNEPVAIANESAIIIWDEDTKTQHLIRRASFETKAPDIGFLVPTPSQPKLAEASDAAFDYLFEVTKPKIETRKRGGCGCAIGCGSKGGKGDRGGVEVLEENRVGDYQYAVLKASDPDALGDWLEKNNYPFPARLKDWAEPYTKKGWIITAFKYDKKKEDAARLAISAVRMTFNTDKPVFPYREPKEEKDGKAGAAPASRLFRVYFLAKKRMQGDLEGGVAWPGVPVWANELKAEQRAKVLEHLKLPAETPPATWWLTEFEDRSNPRPGDADLVFSVAPAQDPLERRPHIQFAQGAWGGCVMSCALTALLIYMPFRGRKKRGQ